jgi:MFS transporter, MHS family, proline/betaine transporter
MGLLSSLTRQQKEAAGLLQVGTFLEYFDLMLYVHMAVLLNELFFPKTDPFTASLLSAFAFCSTFILRPVGALFFGYIGDTFGRKSTVVFTTSMMAVSCIIMANLPTYAEAGILAAWGITLCRMLQGISSLGEMIGAEVYLTESTKPPAQYFVVAAVRAFSDLGGMIALGISNLVLYFTFNWRVAFWIGAGIAMVGSVARTRLRETPEFLKMKREKEENLKKETTVQKQTIDKKKILALLLIFSSWPISFYFSYIFCAEFLKENCGYTSQEVIQQNFFVSIFQLLTSVIFVFLSYRIYPLKIVKFNLFIYYFLALMCPFLLSHFPSGFKLFWLQVCVVIFSSGFPAFAIFYTHFPVSKRITSVSLICAISMASMYVITSFGLVYLIEWCGYFGFWIIMFPTTLAFHWSINHFQKLDRHNREKSEQNLSQEEEQPILKAA